MPLDSPWIFDAPAFTHAVALLDRSGNVLRHNAHFERWSSGRHDDDIFDLIHVDLFDKFQTMWSHTLLAKHQRIHLLAPFDHDESVIFCWELTPLEDQTILLQITDLGADLADFRKADAQAYAQLVPPDPGAALSAREEWNKLMTVAAHDLKAPLRRIITFGELLEADSDALPPTHQAHLTTITENARKLRTLLHEMLEYLRLDPQRYRVETLTTGELLEPLLRKYQLPEFALHAQAGEFSVTVRGELIRGALQRLLDNAVRYRVKERELEVSIEITEESPGMLRWSIQDNGPGIDPMHHESVFEPFTRISTAEQKSGNGLGLAMSKKIIELHGGRIGLSSSPGTGSTFWFTLPVELL